MSHSLVLIGIGQGFKKCDGCGDTIRKHESRWVLAEPRLNADVHILRGFAYCESCDKLALENAEGFEEWDGHVYGSLTQMEDEANDDGERYLRQMEEYAEYQYAGNTESYWTDRDAGYVS
jgi:hypothetical protein